MNNVILTGFIGDNINVYNTEKNNTIIKFHITTKRLIKQADDTDVYIDDFHYVTAFGEYNSQRIKPGLFAIIRGNLKESISTTKEGDEIRYYNVNVYNITVLDVINKNNINNALNITNNITLAGYVGNDINILQTPGKDAIIKFQMATTRGIKQPDGSYEYINDWHYIDAFGEYNAQRIKKGLYVIVNGSLKENKIFKNGGQIRSYNVVANDIAVLEVIKKDDAYSNVNTDLLLNNTMPF